MIPVSVSTGRSIKASAADVVLFRWVRLETEPQTQLRKCSAHGSEFPSQKFVAAAFTVCVYVSSWSPEGAGAAVVSTEPISPKTQRNTWIVSL